MNNQKGKEEAVLKALLSKVLRNDESVFPTSDEAIDILMAESDSEDLREDLLKEIKARLSHKKDTQAEIKKKKSFPTVNLLSFLKPACVAPLFRKKKDIDSKTKEKLERHRKRIKKEQDET